MMGSMQSTGENDEQADSSAPSIGVMLPRDLRARDIVPFIKRAEELGFDELWVVVDCFFRGGIAQAAVALAASATITVGIGIVPAAVRNAAFTTMEVGTLAEMFPGRLLVGIGHGMTGWMRQVGAMPASPLTMLGENLDAIRALLRGETVSTQGRYVTLTDVTLNSPPKLVPPVLAGVRGPRSLALAGTHADGTILAEPVTPEYLAAARAQINAGGPHQIVAYNVAAVDDEVDVARRAARAALGSIGDPDWAPHITPLPFAADFAELRAASATAEEFTALMPDEWVDQLALVGTPERVRGQISALHSAGATSIVLIPVGDDAFDALESLARVLPTE
ncbi:MAG: class flavin-dependent oxidoreductase [Glaciihabitans sp.]|nr:class flavin-dependent oxidoreductase [Glaciihabitans sp.]